MNITYTIGSQSPKTQQITAASIGLTELITLLTTVTGDDLSGFTVLNNDTGEELMDGAQFTGDAEISFLKAGKNA